MRRTLEDGDACMEFLVQPRIPDSLDVEDSLIEWPESQAPFYKVATLRIPRQIFDAPDKMQCVKTSPLHLGMC